METCIKLVGMFINIPDLKVARKQNIERDIYDRLCLEHLLILVLLDAHFLHTESEGHVYRFMMITGCETVKASIPWGICRREPDGHEETIGQCMMNVKSEEHHASWPSLLHWTSSFMIIYDHLWHQGTTNDGETFSLSKWYTAGQVWPGTVLLHQPGCLGHDTIFQLGHIMKPSLCSESNLPPICLHFVFPNPPSRELWPVDRDLIKASTPCPCSVTVKLHPPSFIPTFEQDSAPSRSRWNMGCYYRHSQQTSLWWIRMNYLKSQLTIWDIQKIH